MSKASISVAAAVLFASVGSALAQVISTVNAFSVKLRDFPEARGLSWADHAGWALGVIFPTPRPMGPHSTNQFGQQAWTLDRQRGTSPDRPAPAHAEERQFDALPRSERNS